MIVRKSIQGREARINTPTLVQFDGGNQYGDAGVNSTINNAVIGTSDWSISFFYDALQDNNPGSLFGNRGGGGNFCRFFVLKANASNLSLRVYQSNSVNENLIGIPVNPSGLDHIAVTYQNGIIRVTVNKVLVATFTVSTAYQNASAVTSSNLFFAVSEGLTNYTNFATNHLSFFNRVLTLPEIQQIHRYGGYLPESTHEACVAHYVADREGLTMWDVVGQYNYAKEIRRLSPENEEFLDGHTYGLGEGFSIADGKLIFSGASGGRVSDVRFAGQKATYSGTDSIELTVNVASYSNTSGSTGGFIGIRYGTGTSNELIITQPGIHTTILTHNGDGGNTSLRIRNRRGDDRFEIESIKIKHATNPELEAHHATLQNFTPQQVTGSAQTAYLDFYDKQKHRLISLNPNSVNLSFANIAAFYPGADDFTIEFNLFNILTNSSAYYKYLALGRILILSRQGGFQFIIRAGGSGKNSAIQVNMEWHNEDTYWKKDTIVRIEKLTNDAQNWRVYRNNIEIPDNINILQNDAVIGAPVDGGSSSRLGSVPNKFRYLIDFFRFSVAGTLIDEFNFSGLDPDIESQVVGINGNIINVSRNARTEPVQIEKSSLLPPYQSPEI